MMSVNSGTLSSSLYGAFEPPRSEILVDRAAMLRRAEAEGRFDQVLPQLNAFATAARGDPA